MTSKLKLIIFVLIIGLLSAGSALKPAHADFLSYIHWPSSENTLSQGGEDYGAPALLYRPGIMYMTVPRPDGPISDLQILSSTDMSTWTLVTTISGSHSHAGKMGFIFNPQDQKYYIAYMSDGELVHIPTPSDVPFVADVPMMVVRSSTDLLNWSNPTNMTWEFDNTNYAWDINGPTIVLDSANNRLLVEYAKTLGSPCSCKEVFLNQTSGPNFGQTWSSVSLNPISYGGSPLKVSTTPDLKFINGKLYMTYVDVGPSGGAIHVIQSTDGITWTNKADIPGQTAYSAVIDYNPAEYYPFHLMWVGTDSSYTINDMSSATAMSWTNQETFNGLNGAPLALSHVYPSLTFDANLDILVMAHTGTDWYTQWGYGDYMHVLPEVGAVNDAGFVNQGGSSLFQSTTTTSTFKPNQGTFIEKNNPTYSCAGCGIYIVETDTTRYYSKADTYTSFIGFNPSIPANSVISKATIALTVYDTKQNLCLNMACPMTVSAITSSWTAASVNWDSPPSTSCFSSCVTISAGLVAKGETDTIDISSLVNQAYDAGQFFGIKIETNPTCGYDLCEDWYVDYYSQVTNSGPVLTLTYTYTPSTATLCAGQSAALTVTMSNRGSTIWQPVSTLPGFPFRLGSQNPPGNTIWGISRVDLSSPVRPTTNYVFSFTITAPSTPGTYNLQWQMVQDGIITWFGDKTPNIQVTVTPPCPPDFTISATSPSAVDAGSTGTSTVTINYVNGFTGTVALTATAPAPLNCYSLTPGSLSSTGTAILYCASPSAGTFPVTITGTSGSITHTTVATFTYTDFTVSSLPSTVNIPPSGSGTATLNLSSVNGFAGSV